VTRRGLPVNLEILATRWLAGLRANAPLLLQPPAATTSSRTYLDKVLLGNVHHLVAFLRVVRHVVCQEKAVQPFLLRRSIGSRDSEIFRVSTGTTFSSAATICRFTMRNGRGHDERPHEFAVSRCYTKHLAALHLVAHH
jgi:hypothetical protein